MRATVEMIAPYRRVLRDATSLTVTASTAHAFAPLGIKVLPAWLQNVPTIALGMGSAILMPLRAHAIPVGEGLTAAPRRARANSKTAQTMGCATMELAAVLLGTRGLTAR